MPAKRKDQQPLINVHIHQPVRHTEQHKFYQSDRRSYYTDDQDAALARQQQYYRTRIVHPSHDLAARPDYKYRGDQVAQWVRTPTRFTSEAAHAAHVSMVRGVQREEVRVREVRPRGRWCDECCVGECWCEERYFVGWRERRGSAKGDVEVRKRNGKMQMVVRRG